MNSDDRPTFEEISRTIAGLLVQIPDRELSVASESFTKNDLIEPSKIVLLDTEICRRRYGPVLQGLFSPNGVTESLVAVKTVQNFDDNYEAINAICSRIPLDICVEPRERSEFYRNLRQ